MTGIGEMGVSEWLPVLAAGVGALAAAVGVGLGIRRFRLARRAYALSVEAERQQEPALEVSRQDCRILNLPNDERRIYVFHLAITNTSRTANSIKRIELALEYGRRGQPPSNVVIPHDSSAAMAANMEAAEVIRVPGSIAAGATINGAALFPIAPELIGDGVVESHIVTVTDAHDRGVQCRAILLWEVQS